MTRHQFFVAVGAVANQLALDLDSYTHTVGTGTGGVVYLAGHAIARGRRLNETIELLHAWRDGYLFARDRGLTK